MASTATATVAIAAATTAAFGGDAADAAYAGSQQHGVQPDCSVVVEGYAGNPAPVAEGADLLSMMISRPDDEGAWSMLELTDCSARRLVSGTWRNAPDAAGNALSMLRETAPEIAAWSDMLQNAGAEMAEFENLSAQQVCGCALHYGIDVTH